MEIERRMVQAADLRVVAEGPPRIVGHAALFDRLSEDLGGFRERIRPGAFAASLVADDVRALFNHDPNVILGRNRAGTLRITEDGRGLGIEIDPPDTQAARDLMVSIARGDVSQMSFGFSVAPGGQTWEKDAQGGVLRTLTAEATEEWCSHQERLQIGQTCNILPFGADLNRSVPFGSSSDSDSEAAA